MKQNTADTFFFNLCDVILKQSKDPSTKTSCVIVGPNNEVRSIGYNGIPRGVNDNEDRFVRPLKYKWVEHAERNAIYNAARNGTSIDGCTIYIMWHPCADCARAIIQSGITQVVVPAGSTEYGKDRWGEDFEISRIMFCEANITVREVDKGTLNV
jgi:dCMP deaminase